MIKEKHYVTLEDGSEDGLDMEETRYPYYNDNLDLVGYTSELRDRDGKFFAFVDFSADDDKGKVRYCPHCLEFEIQNKLKPRILEKGEQKPPDYDQFIQCWECGNIYPIYQSYPETEIKDSEETVQTPFENESVFMSTETRKTQRKKRERRDRNRKGVHKYVSKRLEQPDDEDPDIQQEIRKGNIVNILYDSSS